MLKKARSFMRMASAFGFNSILDIIPSHIEYSAKDFAAIVVLATYYCHTNETIMAIIKVMMTIYPNVLRRDKGIHMDKDEVAASWFSIRALQLINEKDANEAGLDVVLEALVEECMVVE